MKHKLCLLTRKNSLPKGIYVDEAYPVSIQNKHATLRPILKLARSKEAYKGKCKLERDNLVITGNKYTIDTLDKLPEELTPYKAAQKSSPDCLVFHGSLTPLSNFNLSPFNIGRKKFYSVEQYIQHKKACHFNDYKIVEKIMQCKTPMDAKTLSCNITNFDKDSWKVVVKDACQPGITAKFEQNPLLLKFLLATSPLKLAESSYDKLWGTGLPLNNDKALNQTQWHNQGLLGEILIDIRDKNKRKL